MIKYFVTIIIIAIFLFATVSLNTLNLARIVLILSTIAVFYYDSWLKANNNGKK
jgi:hypothetical protein